MKIIQFNYITQYRSMGVGMTKTVGKFMDVNITLFYISHVWLQRNRLYSKKFLFSLLFQCRFMIVLAIISATLPFDITQVELDDMDVYKIKNLQQIVSDFLFINILNIIMQNQLLINRSIVKQDKISKILSSYQTDIDKNSQQSFRSLVKKSNEKYKLQVRQDRKSNQQQLIQLSDYQKQIDVSKYFSDYPKSQYNISIKDLLSIKVKSKKYNPKNQRINTKKNCNGSQTNRDSNSFSLYTQEIQMTKLNCNTHSQQPLLQTLINESYETKFNEPRHSPELRNVSQHIFKMLKHPINGQSNLLLCSGSQGNVANTSKSKNKIADLKIQQNQTFIQQTNKIHTSTEQNKLKVEQQPILTTHRNFVKVDQNKIQTIGKIVNQVKNTMDSNNQQLIIYQKTTSMISNYVSIIIQLSFIIIQCHLEIVSNQSNLENEYLNINIQLNSLKALINVLFLWYCLCVQNPITKITISRKNMYLIYKGQGFSGQFNLLFYI